MAYKLWWLRDGQRMSSPVDDADAEAEAVQYEEEETKSSITSSSFRSDSLGIGLSDTLNSKKPLPSFSTIVLVTASDIGVLIGDAVYS